MRRLMLCVMLATLACVVRVNAATVTWDGGGADENWSTAANWSGDAVPGSADDVVFNATSDKDCAVDVDVAVGSLYIYSAYAGIVSAGSHTIEFCVGNFTLGSTSDFDAGTSTLKFTGLANQAMPTGYPSTIYNIENAKSGGSLKFSGYAIPSINTLKSNAGTVTEITHSIAFIKNLDLQGTAGNLAVFKSVTAGDQAAISLTGTQTIKYAELKDINAAYSATASHPFDATDHCVDSGNNNFVYFSGISHWNGGGADANWSTAANWKSGSVPTASDLVLFDELSDKSCTIDTDISIGSLYIYSNYEGVVSAGSHTIEFCVGNFTLGSTSDFDAGTSLLEFTGSANQAMPTGYPSTIYNIENAKSGGSLKFSGYAIPSINTLKGNVGTVTEITHSIAFIKNLDVQGTAGNLAVFKSVTAGDQARVSVTETQTIKYAEFKDIYAHYNSYSQDFDATEGCVDSGNNEYVHFSGLCRWTGATSGDWNTASNWKNGAVPTATDQVIFDGLGTQNCILSSDVTVKELLVDDQYGAGDYGYQLQAGSHGLTVTAGDLDLSTASGKFAAGTGTVTLACGDGEQTLSCAAGTAFYNLETGSALLNNTLEVNLLKVSAGSVVRVLAGKTVTVAALELEGAASAPIELRSSNYLSAWYLTHTGDESSQAVSYVYVDHCNASRGTAIDGTANCRDLGGNVNWTFAAADGVIIPSASATSPLCVEGWVQSTATGAVTVNNGGADETATFAGDRLWYRNMALSAAAAVTITVKDNETVLKSQAVSWTPTDVTAGGETSIRLGDALLLTVGEVDETETMYVDKDYDGTTFDSDVAGETGADDVAVQFTTAGTHTVAARIGTGQISTMTVNVVSADLGSARLGCWVAYSCPRTATVTPESEVENVWFGSGDDTYLIVTEKDASGAARSLTLVAQDLSTAKALVARLGGSQGPILGYKAPDCFNLSWSTATAMPVLKTYGDGDQLLGGTIKMTPHYDDVTVKLYVFTGSALFENGTTTQLLDTGELDANGQINYYMFAPTSGNVCHRMSVVENE